MGRSFLAVRCDVLDAEMRKITQVVEIIYTRVTANGTREQKSYTSGLRNLGLDSKEYFSLMTQTKSDITAIPNFGRLLQGEVFPFSPGGLVSMHLRLSNKV